MTLQRLGKNVGYHVLGAEVYHLYLTRVHSALDEEKTHVDVPCALGVGLAVGDEGHCASVVLEYGGRALLESEPLHKLSGPDDLWQVVGDSDELGLGG